MEKSDLMNIEIKDLDFSDSTTPPEDFIDEIKGLMLAHSIKYKEVLKKEI